MRAATEAPATIRVWHFAAHELRDGRPLPAKGDMLRHEGEVIACRAGLHGSPRAMDAIQYAPGPFVALCELGGTLASHGNPTDKYAASERRYLTGYVDATNVLHRFACWCATKALDREEANGRTVDPRSRAAVAAKLAWLDGEIDEATLAAAWDAARAAAWDAARAAAWAAAWAAARDAAWAAAWAAARDAAWAEFNAELERLLTALVEADSAQDGKP